MRTIDYEKAWQELRREMEADRDNKGEMMSMAESIHTSAHAIHVIRLMNAIETRSK